MTTYKSLIIAIGAITASMPVHSEQALDAEGLYKERACIACHGAEGKMPVMTEYPKIAGQPAPYILAQMKDIKSGVRNNAHAVAMKNAMHLINDAEMAVIAEWLAGLPK
ncbi:MAG: c-type cytochrome [Candidatus Thiodiazotropha sp. (ex Epidulcina cf. delphinae)]|nr:c-type cytochrome [Candidatus Thiodiazotropha sp. (ex Epidulcina cf. delphinae)]